ETLLPADLLRTLGRRGWLASCEAALSYDHERRTVGNAGQAPREFRLRDGGVAPAKPGALDEVLGDHHHVDVSGAEPNPVQMLADDARGVDARPDDVNDLALEHRYVRSFASLENPLERGAH